MIRRTGLLASVLLVVGLWAVPCVRGEGPSDAAPAPSTGGVEAVVRFDARVRSSPATGRVLVFFLREGANVSPRAQPSDAPFYDDPQPLAGLDVRELTPGQAVTLGADAQSFPGPLSALPDGSYRVQAALDCSRTHSDWTDEPGNLYSEIASIQVRGGATQRVELLLDNVVEPRPLPDVPGVQFFEAPSKLLSDFRSGSEKVRAGIVLPVGYDPAKRYPAVYVIGGFGSTHRFAAALARMRSYPGPGLPQLARHAFLIVPDPDSANGHTLFADSDNNGPAGRALVEELIPALEAAYPLIAQPGARLVTGHSSGGWSAVWLLLNYPEVFGNAFSGAPDPLDFRALQKTNIYADANFYTDARGADIPSNVQNGRVLMTVRQENGWEEARGPDNTSGQQWDSWQAVFGPRNARGRPAALFDASTGVIDRDIARAYARFDMSELVRRDPGRLVPLCAGRLRIVVGAEDEWNLDEGVRLFAQTLAELGAPMDGSDGWGRIDIVPGANHGTVMRAPAYDAMYAAMVDLLVSRGFASR